MGLQQLKPRFVERVWGSTKLGPYFPDSSVRIGEVWHDAPDLPVLVKFLFTTEKLSVQVHPPGKTEMWHIISAEPGAKVAAGFCESITRSQLREAAVSGEIMDLLAWYDARPGDTFFIPAGTVHAIGEGLVLCEIQQHSDITYRLYDYGRGRPLHLDVGLEVSDREPADPRRPGHEGVLVTCPFFTTSKVNLQGKLTPAATNQQAVWIVLDGTAQIAGEPAQPGEVWYESPNAAPFDIEGTATLLHVSSLG